MAIRVEIEIEDDGAVSVGVCQGKDSTGKPHLKPVASIDVALKQARSLLVHGMQTQARY